MNSWLKDKYGSRRGAMQMHRHFFLYLFGKYNAYRQINWDEIDRLVFVCKGNICRSAYAEAFAKSLGVEAISCGIETKLGVPANETAIKVSASRGFDLGEHRTTPITALKFKENDLILAMEPWQVEYLSNNFNGSQNISLLGLWGKSKRPYIHDPYSSSPIYFNNCFNYIENSIHEVASKISNNRL